MLSSEKVAGNYLRTNVSDSNFSLGSEKVFMTWICWWKVPGKLGVLKAFSTSNDNWWNRNRQTASKKLAYRNDYRTLPKWNMIKQFDGWNFVLPLRTPPQHGTDMSRRRKLLTHHHNTIIYYRGVLKKSNVLKATESFPKNVMSVEKSLFCNLFFNIKYFQVTFSILELSHRTEFIRSSGWSTFINNFHRKCIKAQVLVI